MRYWARKSGQRRDEDTVRNVFRQSDLLDLPPTPAYTFRFLKDGLFRGPGGVAQLGERLNGIQEVRGSIPLASIGYVTPKTAAGCQSLLAGWTLGWGPSADGSLLEIAGIAQLVEHNLAKVGVAGSSPVSRSERRMGDVGRGRLPINSDFIGRRVLPHPTSHVGFSRAVSSVG